MGRATISAHETQNFDQHYIGNWHLLSFARDPPGAIFGHCFRIHLQVAVTCSISDKIPPKFVNNISNICT
jgi:hypothetical protein